MDRIIAVIHIILSLTTAQPSNISDNQQQLTYSQLFNTSNQLQEQLEEADIKWTIQTIKQHPNSKPTNANYTNDIQKHLVNAYDNLQVINDVLFHTKVNTKGQQQQRYVMPKHLITWAINAAHQTPYSGHLGINKTFAKLEQRF